MIPGYRAIIDPAAAGLGFEAVVQITMDRQDASMIAGFERGLAAIPEIRHPERLLSDPGHLVRPPPPDLACCQALRDEKLATCPACSG